MNSSIFAPYFMEIVVTLTITYILYQLKIHHMLTKLKHRQYSLEQTLFGYNPDRDDDGGYINNSKDRFNKLEDNLDDVSEDVNNIEKTVVEIDAKLDYIVNDLDDFDEDDNDD